jgi:hypothetical protein
MTLLGSARIAKKKLNGVVTSRCGRDKNQQWRYRRRVRLVGEEEGIKNVTAMGVRIEDL